MSEATPASSTERVARGRPELVAGYIPEVNILNGCDLSLQRASSSASSAPTAPASRRC